MPNPNLPINFRKNTYIGARYVPKFSDTPGSEWDNSIQYEPLTIVLYQGNSYTSKTFVPVGVDINNTTYWAITGNYNAQVGFIQQELAKINSPYFYDSLNELINDSNITIGKYAVIKNPASTMYYISDTPVEPYVQLANNLYANNVSSEIYVSAFKGANTAEKLQNAINYSINSYYPTVTIDIPVDLTGATIKINKGLYISNNEYLRYRSKLTITSTGNGKIFKKDNGYMFTADKVSGDIQFISVIFEGNVVLDASGDGSEKLTSCYAFNTNQLIRLTTIGCSFTLMGSVFDNSNFNVNLNAQTITSIGDLVTYCGSFCNFTKLWDVKIQGATIENCYNAFKSVGNNSNTIIHLMIDECCIESCNNGGIILVNSYDTLINNLVISKCYFESNGGVHIDISQTVNSATITENNFAGARDGAIKVRIPNYLMLMRIEKNRLSSGGTFLIIENGNTVYPLLLNQNDYSSTSIISDKSYYMDLSKDGLTTPIQYEYNLFTDVKNCINVYHNGNMTIPADNTITNLPIENTAGFLHWNSFNGGAMLWFVTQSNVYLMYRIGGIGWSSWKTITSN